jgi:hypothetical protein
MYDRLPFGILGTQWGAVITFGFRSEDLHNLRLASLFLGDSI